MGNCPRLGFLIVVALAAIGPSTLESQEKPEEAVRGYLFVGADASARSGKAFLPIVGVDSRRMLVDTGSKTKRVSLRAACRANKRLSVSDKFIQILDIDLGAVSVANLNRTADAIADAQFMDMQAESAISDVRSGAASNLPLRGGVDTRLGVDEFERSNEDFQQDALIKLQDGAYGIDGVADTVIIQGEVIPHSDISGAYCLLVVDFGAIDYDSKESLGRRRIGGIRYVGDLRKDEIEKLNLRFSLSEFSLRSVEYSLHLYSDSGDEVAMSSSKGLKALTHSEYEKLNTALN
jgi:hypothetical protein